MTELPGLPPFGAEPAFAADEDTYARLTGRAAGRRRRRLAATSAAAVVAVAFAWAGGPAANGRSGLSPTDDPPSASPAPSSTAEPEPRPTGAPGPAASPTPGGPGPSAEPTPEPTADPTTEPTPTGDSGCGRHADGWTDCHAPGGPPATPRPEWHESSTMSDAALAGCAQDERETAEGWCFRFLGPESTTSGVETDFSAELCRISEHRGSDLSYAEFAKDRELAILLSSGDRDGDGEIDHVASSFHGLRNASHRRYIPAGRCLRWSVTWNGIADDGRVLPPGEYSLSVMLLGETPRRPLPGEADQSTSTGHGETREGYRVG